MGVPHTHAEVEVNLSWHGGVTYLAGGRLRHVAPGRLLVFWAGLPHRVIEVEPGTRFGWLTVPLTWVLALSPASRLATRLLNGDMLEAPADATGALDGPLLERWAADLATDDDVRREAARLEIVARMHRLEAALGTADGDNAEGPLAAPGRLEQLATHCAEHYREPLSVPAIAAAVGLHPSHAMAVFRQGCGISLWSYVVRLRVAHAQRLLLTSAEPMPVIAQDAGFGSVESLYSAFRTVCGQTPGQFRRQAAAGPGA